MDQNNPDTEKVIKIAASVFTDVLADWGIGDAVAYDHADAIIEEFLTKFGDALPDDPAELLP